MTLFFLRVAVTSLIYYFNQPGICYSLQPKSIGRCEHLSVFIYSVNTYQLCIFSSCWSKNWLHVVYSFTGFCMFVLSLVKKHYRLQFYMVCISQVTLSSTAYSSSSHQPLSSSHPTADFPFLLPLGEGSEICSWALSLLSLKQITVIWCTLCRVRRIWLIWNSLSAVKTLPQLVRLDLSFPTCSSTCCLLPPTLSPMGIFNVHFICVHLAASSVSRPSVHSESIAVDRLQSGRGYIPVQWRCGVCVCHSSLLGPMWPCWLWLLSPTL